MKRMAVACALTSALALTGCSGEAARATDDAPPVTPAADKAASTGASAPAAAESADKEPSNPIKKIFDNAPEYREVTVPAGTVLPLELNTAVGSDTSNVEDQVRATLRRGITVDGLQALPAGTKVTGIVTAAERSARVKGRAHIAFRFTHADPPGDAERLSIRTATYARTAEATKKQDAAKIGGGAVGGAVIGGLLGGKGGAAKGAAIGGAGGTGVVLATRGKEVRLAPGTAVSVKLTTPLVVRVRVKR